MSKLHRSSILFGVAPLIIGAGVFALWYFTKADVLMLVGIGTIVGGLVAVLVAAICLVIYLYRETQRKTSAKTLLQEGLLSGSIIIVNFPLAFILVFSAITIITTYTITIRNKSSSMISKITITAPGVRRIVEQIPPNDEVTQKFKFWSDGVLRFSGVQNENEFIGTIEGYVTSGMGGESIIMIKNNGKYEVIKD